MDCKDTFIKVFSLKNPKSEGYYHVDTDLHKATSDAYPFEGIRSLFLGPITTSRFNAHFVLPSDAIYIIRWNLMKTQATDEEWQRTWSKTIVVDLINPQSVNISE